MNPALSGQSADQAQIQPREIASSKREATFRVARAQRRLPPLLICLTSLVLFARLLSFTWKNSVNILAWDQWDFYAAFIQHRSLWEIFDWQYGPHRQGIGFVFDWILANLTHWNSRAEALAAVGIVACAAVLALYLKYRLFGSFGFADVIIPLLFLSPLQYETVLGAINLSHGPFPLLLTVLICLAWAQPNRAVRYTFVLIVNFLMIFTAFGFFMGLITPCLLAWDSYRGIRDSKRGIALGGILALAVSLLSLCFFFRGYTFQPAADCFHFPYSNMLAYPWYAGLLYAAVFGIKGHSVIISLIGLALLTFVIAALVYHLRAMWGADAEAGGVSGIIAVLLSYSLVFGFANAVGRVCLGITTADSSRYYLYDMIAMFGFYLHLLTLGKKTKSRSWGVPVLLAVSAAACLYMTRGDRATVRWFSEGKREWRSCYLQTENIAGCDRATGFQIYTRPEETDLKGKLDYLKENKLNLYADP